MAVRGKGVHPFFHVVMKHSYFALSSSVLAVPKSICLCLCLYMSLSLSASVSASDLPSTFLPFCSSFCWSFYLLPCLTLSVFAFLSLSTMGQNREKHRINSHPIIHCPTNEGVSEVSRAEQAQRVSGASEQANGRASGPVLQSVFLALLAHSALW